MSRIASGTQIDGFTVGERIHSGAMADIYAVTSTSAQTVTSFPLVMKVPRMAEGDGAENIISFEVEHQMLQQLAGSHVPRFVAAGDLRRLPYLVMEHVPGQTLQQRLDAQSPLPAPQVRTLGLALAHAAHSLHRQDVCHLDLKPANVILRPDGVAVLLDFGLSCHGHYPDLLAEEMRLAVGSPAWIAPEQIVGVRGDPRSDIFAIGVMLYELATGELPFGSPQTRGGLRQRMWIPPKPPRALRPDIPEWLQEIILRCLAPDAASRYPSAAHLALDLAEPDQVTITPAGQRTTGLGAWQLLRRWVRAAGAHYQPSPLASRQIDEAPILMVAVPWREASDATLYSLRQAVARSMGLRPGARLACVTVIAPGQTSATSHDSSETTVHRRHLAVLREWALPLNLAGHSVSFHVLESGDVADALLRYAQANHVTVIVMGAATHGLQTQRLLATVPIKVAMGAQCTVILVKAALPFGLLQAAD